MLGRMVAKLLFKACVPLLLLAGVMTYGLYLKGGDPARMWKHVSSGALGQAYGMFTQARDDVVDLAGKAAPSMDASHSAATTRVFKWKDAQGVTHFGTEAPVGEQATAISVDPNTNVLAPVASQVVDQNQGSPRSVVSGQADAGDGFAEKSRRGQVAGDDGTRSAVQQLESEMGEPLPGIAGRLLSGGGSGASGLDASQLIKLLQSAEH